MPELQFRVGDFVKLRSGGPKMTVIGYDGAYDNPLYKCHWFDAGGALHEGSFIGIELEIDNT